MEAEQVLRAEIQVNVVQRAQGLVVSISAMMREYPHMQAEDCHVNVALSQLAELVLETDQRLGSHVVNVMSDEAMAVDMVQLRCHADVLDVAANHAQTTMDLELQRIARRRQVVVDGVQEIRSTQFAALLAQQEKLQKQVRGEVVGRHYGPGLVFAAAAAAALFVRSGSTCLLACLRAIVSAGSDGGFATEGRVRQDQDERRLLCPLATCGPHLHPRHNIHPSAQARLWWARADASILRSSTISLAVRYLA
jgi:hypothetical protein